VTDAWHVENSYLADAADGDLGESEPRECTEGGEHGAFD
jgi:hypothetical protein